MTLKNKNVQSTPLSVWKNPIHFVAFGFGAGCLRPAPGTWGTFAAIPLLFLLANTSAWTYGFVLIVLFLIGLWASDITTQDIGVEDHPGIVIDEIVGMLLTMSLVTITWQSIFVGILFFRAFDILKPTPIKQVESHYSGGFGIMIDDVVAGLMSMICVYLVMAIW